MNDEDFLCTKFQFSSTIFAKSKANKLLRKPNDPGLKPLGVSSKVSKVDVRIFRETCELKVDRL